MNVRWICRHCDAHKETARSYWQEKVPRLERLLARSGAERSRLDMTLDYRENRKRWELRAALYLPTGLIVTDEEADDLHRVLDTVADELVRQVERHRSKIRKRRLRGRRQRRREHFEAVTRSLQSDFKLQRPAPFFELFKPLLCAVQSHAARELRILELDETIPPGEVSVDDLVDDVLVAAWESFGDRPPNTPMDVWLIGILHERLAELQQSYGDTKLSSPVEHVASVEGRDSDLDDLSYWLSQALEPEEPMTLEDLLVEEEAGDWLRDLETKEQQQRILSYLQQLPKHERQAFMLSEIEGFELAEIALALERTESEIAADIESARTFLRNAVLQDNS